MSAALVFTTDGRAQGLYTEAIDLSLLGVLSIRRATSIEFDNSKQYWRVRDPQGFALFNSPSREACVAWERQYLETEEDNRHDELPRGCRAAAVGA